MSDRAAGEHRTSSVDTTSDSTVNHVVHSHIDKRSTGDQPRHDLQNCVENDPALFGSCIRAAFKLGKSGVVQLPRSRGADPFHFREPLQFQQPVQFDNTVVFDRPVKFGGSVYFHKTVVVDNPTSVHSIHDANVGLRDRKRTKSSSLTDVTGTAENTYESPRGGHRIGDRMRGPPPPSAQTEGAARKGAGGAASDSRTNNFFGGANGTVDRAWRRGQRNKFASAVFIHAGAGFHSHQNERVHLEACNDAASMGMKFLRSGATAVEAVEAALRVLEDKEITNAGYGSNLSIDGTVECDATIVDHLGRSGACGAVPNVRNPICLAKLILDKSNQPLTLRRVPPNILVGDGAKNFAVENGMKVVPNDTLISKNARDRFLRWQEDLKRADEKFKIEGPRKVQDSTNICPNSLPCQQYETTSSSASAEIRNGSAQQRDHANAILTGTWNEGQPDSPYHGSPTLEKAQGQSFSAPATAAASSRASPAQNRDKSPLSMVGGRSSPGKARSPSPKASRPAVTGTLQSTSSHPAHEGHRDGGRSPRVSETKSDPQEVSLSGMRASRGIKRPFPFMEGEDEERPPMDMITDTVGAIAIDEKGNIAAGSSSGGIGMKHRGRLGPASLVGIGTAVVPSDPDDPDGVCVATVTSGTGEHMATTMASQRCAERIYRNTRRGDHGQDVEEMDEDVIMESFISQDFMSHPGVRNCNSVGAIGVMTVKKSRTGYYLYFAHNTDSFALASMGGSDKQPQCVMSRLGPSGQVTRGARKIRLD